MKADYLSQDTEIKLLSVIVQFLDTRNFIDIGAEKGAFAQCLLEKGLPGVLIEPLPAHQLTLTELVERNPGARLLPFAISDSDADGELFIAKNSDGVELDHFHSLQKARAPGVFEHQMSIPVRCRSLSSLKEEGLIPDFIGILKIDTEGNDLRVLKGMGSLRPEIVVCEYFSNEIYDGWTESSADVIVRYMEELGYNKYLITKRVSGLEFIGVMSTTCHDRQWGNLFFFKNETFSDCLQEINNIIRESEAMLVEQFNLLHIELDKKEDVIKELSHSSKERLDVIEMLDAEIKRLRIRNTKSPE
ncbi:MAG: FkbM family methyltransferase [Ekhidna sp.]